MKTFNKILLATGLCLLFSCDVIHQEPEDRIAESNYWKTQADAVSAIIGVYDRVQSLALYNPLAYVASTDEVTFNNAADGYLQFNAHNLTVDNTQVEAYWQFNYSGMHRVNDIISRVPGINDKAFTEEEKAEIVAEAKFLRAYFYYNLVNGYGGVPIVVKPYESFNVDFTIPKSTVAEVYSQISSDLADAETNIPNSFSDAIQTRGRATKGAAKALLAKVYLTTKEYRKAADKATEVINNPLYTLVTGATNYTNMFTPAGRNTSEAIWEVQFVSSTSEGHGLHSRFMPQSNQSTTVGGQYQIVPSQKIQDAFDPGDIRKDASIAVSTTPQFKTAGQPYVKKHNRSNSNEDPNIIALRLADIILIRAEALNKLGETAAAIADLNTIRRRAFNVPLTTPSVYDYPNASDIAKNFDLTAAIENERFLELAFEGHRWMDLKRNNRAEAVLGIPTFRTVWPIPQRERNRNPKLEQNTDYK
ncbi:RagB/SusD family nutrient uptake outer membrane protein [Desertivirga xinjiangensis]|uniref:RagB/SusD family nutrient uptake outer membrane protein n=1 Tax=Desertivirga xinjiangensis TaxID=539206 RepID=UPI00210EA5E3|nr:RagB/SusD family nutrient uptake outer membrane protein [Pedobacter xinjiangensis]